MILLKDTTKTFAGEVYIDGKRAGKIEGVRCYERYKREGNINCLFNCKEKERCNRVMKMRGYKEI